MVYLKRIETKGFKSLGAKILSVPVEKGFIAITGPNGSGKSNLLDSIIFALGENSPKTLRVPNLGALIYDGSVEEQKPSSAKVTLQFDNTERRIPVDTDSVSISRELKQSGESTYSLNGKHIQRNNLGEVLEMALITSRGLNVVLQGMITRISELVPDEKRKLIEQMVGVAQFDEKKNLALSQLNEADRKLEVAMAKIGEIRDRVQSLEQERNDQLRVKQLEDQVSWLRAVSISAKLIRVRGLIDQRRNQATESGARLSRLQSRQVEIRASLDSMEAERSQLIKSAMDAGAAKVELEVAKLSNAIESLQRERREAANYVDRFRQVIPTLEQMSQGQESRIAQTESQIRSLQEKTATLEQVRDKVLLEQKALVEERSLFERELSSVQRRLGLLRRSKDNYDAKLRLSQDRANKVVSELRAAKDRKAATEDKIKFFEEHLSAARKNISDLEELLSSQRKELGELKRSQERVEKLGRRVEGQLEIAAMILEKAGSAVRDYDSELSAMENVAGEEIAIARLDELGKSNALDGYFGPLRSLVSYDPEYAQAVAALGKDWLNAIIVRDVPSLLRVTEAARKLKIGRLTVVPLSEVGAAEASKATPREALYLASDVVQSQSAVRNVVEFVFGESVIVDSPKTAFLLARRGFRAVTLQGDIFEPELLAFETGYSKKYLQIATLLSQQQSYEGIKQILASLQKLVERRKTSIVGIHAKGKDYSEHAHGYDLEISKIETKLETTKQFVSRYAEDTKTLSDRVGQCERDIHRLEKDFRTSEKRIAAFELGSAKLAGIISSFDLSSFDSKASEFNRRRSELDQKIDGITSEIRDSATEVTRLRGDLENNQKPSLERLRQQKAESEAKFAEQSRFLEESVPRLASLEGELAALREREAEILDRAAKYQPLLDELDSKIKSLKAEEEALRKSVGATDKEYFTLTNDLTRLSDNEHSFAGELSMYGYPEPVEAFDGADDLLRELQGEYDLLRKSVNFNADKNYREIFENYKYSSVRKNELEKERNAIVIFIETIDAEKRKVFMDAFERIDKELRVIFTKITNGNAWLELENPDSIFDSGVFLMAQFPGKLPRDSSSVSGGEKTMSALSFILAIQAVFPSPFYVFDEVDAHLDSVYSGKLAEILAERCAYSQIIIVSLKDTVVSKATSVIGVYMNQGSSRVIRYKSGMEVEVKAE